MTFDEWTKTSVLWNGLDWYLNKINNQSKSIRTNKSNQKDVPKMVMFDVLSKSDLDKINNMFNRELVLNSS
jgi:hypothetical protein